MNLKSVKFIFVSSVIEGIQQPKMGAQQGKPSSGFEVGPPPPKPISRIKGLKPRQAPRSPVISQGPMSIMGPAATTLNYFSEHTGKTNSQFYYKTQKQGIPWYIFLLPRGHYKQKILKVSSKQLHLQKFPQFFNSIQNYE